MGHRYHRHSLASCAEWLAASLIGLALAGPALAEGPADSGIDATTGDSAITGTDEADSVPFMLPIPVTTPEQKRLAADLLDAIEHGDLKRAEASLSVAIETGTLAITLADRLQDPHLLAILRGLDLHDVPQPTASPAQGDPASPEVAANLAQLQNALQQEQAHSRTVAQTLNDLTAQYDALKARTETEASGTSLKVSDLQNALQQEQAHSRTVAQTLNDLAAQYDALKSQAKTEASDKSLKIADLEKALQQEQQQRQTAAQELASLQSEYQMLQAAKEALGSSTSSAVSNLETQLQHEHDRRQDAERQLARARQEVSDLLIVKDREAKSAARVAGLEDSLAQAQARADESARKLADATEALRTIREVNERTSIAAISQSATAEAGETMALLQTAASAPEASAPSVTGSSAALSHDEPPATNGSPVEVARLPDDVRPLPPIPAPEAAPALTRREPVPEPKADAPSPAVKVDDRLTARADELLHEGDVSGARLLLERSMKNGNARAAFLLAETFDPRILSKLGVLGLRGDAGKARELYAKAQELGMSAASERLEQLK